MQRTTKSILWLFLCFLDKSMLEKSTWYSAFVAVGNKSYKCQYTERNLFQKFQLQMLT